MVCEINGQIVDCGVFWHSEGGLFLVVFALLGLLFAFKPDWLIRFQIWSNGLVGIEMKVKNKRFYKFIRVLGIICFLIAIYAAYNLFF